MTERLSNYERETIINFNRAEDTASIFTYEKVWQKHLEKKLGFKPVFDNGFGGKEYVIPKRMIGLPRVPRRLSDSAKRKLTEQLRKNRLKVQKT